MGYAALAIASMIFFVLAFKFMGIGIRTMWFIAMSDSWYPRIIFAIVIIGLAVYFSN
jgi:hypothetical protein